MSHALRFVSLLLFVASALALVATPAEAQRISVEGTVTSDDGTPVVGAQILVLPETGTTPLAKTKSKKEGKFRVFFFPRVQAGNYRFQALKEGLLMSNIDVKLKGADGEVGAKFDLEIGALQELHKFTLRQSGGAEVRIRMVPEETFAKYLVVKGDADATERLGEANRLSGEGDFDGSDAILKELIGSGVEQANVFYLLGRNALSRKMNKEGAEWFARALELDSKLEGVRGTLASVAQEEGDLEKALEYYEQELELFPDARTAAVGRGIVLRDLGRNEEAEAALSDVIAAHPEELTAYAELAIVYMETDRQDDALAVLEKMAGAGGTDPVLWFNVGANFSNRKQYEQAEMAYRKSLEIDSGFADAIRELGMLQIRKGQSADAVEYLERYLEMRPDAPDAQQVRSIHEALTKSQGS